MSKVTSSASLSHNSSVFHRPGSNVAFGSLDPYSESCAGSGWSWCMLRMAGPRSGTTAG